MSKGTYFLFSALLFLCTSMQGQYQSGFYENKGQWPSDVHYVGAIKGGFVFIAEQGLVFQIIEGHNHSSESLPLQIHFSQEFRNSKISSIEARGKKPYKSNFFLGNDSTKWARNVHTFDKLFLQEYVEGVDLYLSLNQGQFKTDWVETIPGAINQLQWKYQGIADPIIEEDGMFFRHGKFSWKERIPGAFTWESQDDITPFSCSYTQENGWFRFKEVGNETCHWIDPELKFSTFSGSVSNNFGYTASYDTAGFLYAGSTVFGPNYPLKNPFDDSYNTTTANGNVDIAITKYDTTGKDIIYSTFIGGNSGEAPHSLVCNAQGEMFCLGTTGSTDCPVSADAIQPNLVPSGGLAVGGSGFRYDFGVDFFIFGLSSAGDQLVGATYLGGSAHDGVFFRSNFAANYADNYRGEIDFDPYGNLIIGSTVASGDFPTTSNAYQPSATVGVGSLVGVVFKISQDFSSLLTSTYFSGSEKNTVFSLETDEAGKVFIAGGTDSPDIFPFATGRYQRVISPGGSVDAYVAVLDQNLETLEFGTYLGGPEYDQAYFVELDKVGNVYLAGQTLSFNQNKFNQGCDLNDKEERGSLFVTKFDPELRSIDWSFTLGDGEPHLQLSPTALLVDLCYNVYLGGWGGGINILGGSSAYSHGTVANYPVTPDAVKSVTDGSDFYLFATNGDADEISFGTYFGGDHTPGTREGEHVDGGTNRLDPKGVLYQIVCAECGIPPANSTFPIFPPDAFATSKGSAATECNSAVFKFDFELPMVIVDFELDPIQCIQTPVVPRNYTSGGQSFFWDFGNGTTSSQYSPSIFYPSPGDYTITLHSENAGTCNGVDSIKRTIHILAGGNTSIAPQLVCAGDEFTIGRDLPLVGSVTYRWEPAISTINAPNSPITTIIADSNRTYLLIIETGTCIDTTSYPILSNFPPLIPSQIIHCDPESPVELIADSEGFADRFTWYRETKDSDPINFGFSDSSIFVTVDSVANFIIEVSKGNCTRTDTVKVIVPVRSHQLSAEQIVCKNDTVEIMPLENFPSFQYQWDFHPNIISPLTNPKVFVKVEFNDWYKVNVTTPGGCQFRDSIEIQRSLLREADFTLHQSERPPSVGYEFEIQVTPAGNYSYNWSPPEYFYPNTGDLVTVILTDTSWFSYTVIINEGGCETFVIGATKAKEIICGPPNLFVPTAFSPNGDGQNDIAFVAGNFITEMDWQIFDRWGKEVFRSFDPEIGWDGNFNAKLVDPGVFVYQIVVKCDDGEQFIQKGNITVLR